MMIWCGHYEDLGLVPTHYLLSILDLCTGISTLTDSTNSVEEHTLIDKKVYEYQLLQG